MEYFNIDGFPDYRLVRESERDFYVISRRKNGKWNKIGQRRDDGHIPITLIDNDIVKDTYVHILVADQYIPNDYNLSDVHHKDFDPTNDNPLNLLRLSRGDHMKLHHSGNKYCLGKHRSNETRKKMSEAHKGKPRPEGSGRKSKAVGQLTTDGKLIEKFGSATEAAIKAEVHPVTIRQCCRGEIKTAGGYKWVYLD